MNNPIGLVVQTQGAMRMWNGSLVIDAVTHGYDWRPENRLDTVAPEAYQNFLHWLHDFAHVPLESLEPGYLLSFEEYTAGWNVEELAQLFFEESDVDIVAYHHVDIPGAYKTGSSPWWIGAELKRAFPDRVLLYAGVDPLMGPGELDLMQEKIETGLVDGFKFYPANGVYDAKTGLPKTMLYDDPQLAYPYFELAQKLGVTRMAVHKGLPVGPGSSEKDRVEDVSMAALAFPDLTFEIVHSGFAFLEECTMQLMMHPNVYANLETVVNGVVRRPRKFAQILGEMLQVGAEDRILWGTGAPASHPQPVIEAFAALEMPEDLMAGYDYPELTSEIKEKILGGNMARLHGIDPAACLERIRDDEWSKRRAAAVAAGGVGPWKAHRERIAREGLIHA